EDSTPAPKPAPERTEPTPQQIETALRLTRTQRSEIQADLTLLGHDTRGVDGIFGRGSRTAIAEWQQSAGFEATGYLTADQVTILDRQAERRRDTINAEDRRFWQLTGQSGQVDDLRLYLDRYPNGLYAAQAREQLAAINAESRAEEDRAAWESASAANTAEAYREYLRRFEDGLFADVARARLAAIEREETDDSAAIAAEERMNLNRGSRLAIETALATRGFRVGQIDGEFDAATRRAIADFQASKGLAATGYIDPATFRALLLG
ncbi:MAG TPA: peptidoglycan-binding domain-containing protein, partial [Paracoccaceae bacterium]|nr:peptidoglycan-binding domain-containing protein [Paracoccaceae bacterium]